MTVNWRGFFNMHALVHKQTVNLGLKTKLLQTLKPKIINRDCNCTRLWDGNGEEGNSQCISC